MRFQPKTEEELQAENLFPDGEYDFEVVEAEEAKSRKGSDMIKINMKVYGPNGRQQFVRDYLLEAMAYKLRHFCEATGLLPDYEAGTLTDAKVNGRSGRVKLVTESGRKNPTTGADYPARNAVKDYVTDGVKPNIPPVTAGGGSMSSDMEDTDIPF
jgi:hypothetical protein